MSTGNSKVIGFIGVDCYDYILYLTRILTILGCKVLLIDYSCTQSLTYCIPHPKDMDSYKEIVEYKGFDFTRRIFSLEWEGEYDFIFIFYGLYDLKNYSMCNFYILLSDGQRHHLDRIKVLKVEDEKVLQILLKDTEDVINKQYVLSLMGKNSFPSVYLLNQRIQEYKNKCMLQSQQFPSLKGMGEEVLQYLFITVKILRPSTKEKEFKKVIRTMKRRQKIGI